MQRINEYNIIPIGYVCDVTSFTIQVNKRSKAYFFDRFGTPMWAVNELLQNDFKDFMMKENMKCERLFTNPDSPNILYDSKYYIRFPVKNVNDERFSHLVESFKKRKDAFIELLSNTNDTILFIRSEEHTNYSDWGERIKLPEYEERYQHDEYHYLQIFSKLIKTKFPSLKFKILFLNKKGKIIDKEHHIVGITAPILNYRDKNIGKEILSIIKSNDEFITNEL